MGKQKISKVRHFSINFQQLSLVSSFNSLFVLDANHSLSIVDVLDGHKDEIIAFDVSQAQKIVASISERQLVIHCLVDSEPAQNFIKDNLDNKIQKEEKLHRSDYLHLIQNAKSSRTDTKLNLEPLQDFAVYTGNLRWMMTYRVDLSPELPATSLAMSQLGDFLVIAGRQNLSIWCQEFQFDTYNKHIIYTLEEKPEEYSQVKEQLESLTGEIVQVEICGAGRMIVSLEKGKRTLKIWHQEFAMIKPEKEPDVKVRTQKFDPLEVYELPSSQLRGLSKDNNTFAISRFQILHKEFNSLWIVPTVILTISEGTQEVAIWVEQLTEQNLQFNCVKVIVRKSFNLVMDSIFDAQFLQTTQYTPRQDFEKVEKWHASPLFEAWRDKELYFRKIYQPKNETFGIVPHKLRPRPLLSQNTTAALVDWLLMMKDERIEILKCTGLRDFPQRTAQIELTKILHIPKSIISLFQPTLIQHAYCKCFTDQINLLCTNQNGQLIKLWCDLQDPLTEVKLEASGMLQGSQTSIKENLTHPQLPVFALILESEIQVFIQSESMHPIHRRPEMQYLGNFRSANEILSAKWIPDTLQLLVLETSRDSSIKIVSQKSLFKLGGILEDAQKLQSELHSKATKLSPNGTLYEIEPESFEVVVKVAIDLVNCKDIFVVSHDLHLQKQALVFAAITQTGQQQLRKVTWQVEDCSAVDIQSEVVEQRYGFDDGFELHKILASNEAYILKDTYVLVIVSKEQEQEKLARGPEKKPFCKMILLDYSNHSIKERFVLQGIAEELLERPIHARFGKKQLGMIISQGDFHTESKHLYLYDFVEEKYKGFIDFSAMVYGQTKTSKVDFVFLDDQNRGAIAVFVDEDAYLLGEKETKWNIEHKIKGFLNVQASTIQSLKVCIINNQYKNCMKILINNQHIHSFFDEEILANFNIDDDAPRNIDQFQFGNFRENSLHKHFVQNQRSMALFYPGLLEALYIKGYGSLVVKLMVKMHEALKNYQSLDNSQVISDYIDMDLEALLIEIKSQSEAFVLLQGGGQAQAASSKKIKAFSAFDDLDENSSSEEEKKGKGEDTAKDFIKEFKTNCDDFIQLLMKRAMVNFGLTKQETMHLIAFVMKFRNIFDKEFYSDVLASQLLRKIFVESEEVDNNFMEKAQNTIEYYNEYSKKEIIIKAQDKEHGELHLCKDWTSEMVAQALHSENQDVILDTISKRFDFDQFLTWSLMRRLSIPLWLKDVTKLKELLELVIKNEYKIAKEKEALAKGLEKQKLEQMDRDGKIVFGNKEAIPPKVESSALWYILLGKLTILQNLYKYEPGQEKFSEFFGKNFKDEKVRSIASKNAMALVPKKKYLLACGFFILANDLVGAANVAIDRLKDPTLALTICKIHDPTNQTNQIDRILDNEFIKRGEILNDLYIQNIGSWLKKDFLEAVNLLSSEKEGNALSFMFKNASIEFNLCPQLQRPPTEEDISRKPKGENFTKFDKEEEVQQYPVISQKSYIILDIVKKLQKAPDVKRMLNKNWTLDKKKGQKSIFDDFLGEDEESSEEEHKPAILINEAKLLQFAVQQTLNQRYTILGILLIEENPNLKSQISPDKRLKLAKTILQDQIVGFTNKNKVQKHSNLKAVFSLLSKALDIHLKSAMDFIVNACRKLGLIKQEIEILNELQDDGKDLALDRIFTESQRLSGFILNCNKFGGFVFDGCDTNLAINEQTLPLIIQIQNLIECLIFQSTQPPRAAENFLWNQSSPEKRPKQSFFDDEDEDEGNVRKSDNLLLNKVTNLIKNQNATQLSFANIAQAAQNDPVIVQEKNKLQNEINLILRSMVFILTTMFHLALLFNKHHLMKELMAQIQTLVNVSLQFGIQFADGSMTLEKLEHAKGQFQFYAVKVMAMKLRNSIEHNLKWGSQALKQMKADAELGQYATQFQRRKEARDLDQSKDPAHFQFIRIWLKAVCVHQLIKLFQEKRLKDLQFITSLPQKSTIVEDSSKKLKHLSSDYDFVKKNLSLIQLLKASYLQKANFGFVTMIDSFECLNQTMEDVVTHLFQNRLTLKDQFSLVNDLENFHKNRYMTSNGQAIDGSYFFPSDLKFKDFFLNLELHAYTALLKEHHLSLLRTKQGGDNSGDYSHDSQNPYQNQVDRLSESPTKVNKLKTLTTTSSINQHISSNLLKTANSYEFDRGMDNGTETYVNLKLNNGIEIFKQRNECISDFCFDQCNNDLIAFAMQARGMREISVKNTLLYRNRTVHGFEFVDEEYLSWTECLHRLDQIAIVHQKLKPKSDSVKAAYGMICQPSSFGTHKLEKRRHTLLLDQELSPPDIYLGDSYDNYLRPSSNLDITHEDYSNAIQSHPKLPLYVTGNSKGLLCLWSFGQIKDQSLNQWILDPEVPPNLANPKKSTVKKIAFSDCGDKICALNMDGAFFMMNFDLSEISKQTSLFSTNTWAKNKEFRANDFQLLDGDSIVACCSIKEKSLQVFDTMMSQKHSCVLNLKAGGAGNLMTVNTNKQKIYCFNAKPGQINEYDLRMMKDTVNSASLGKEEITAVTIDPISDALIVGFNDGVVKIYDDATVAPVATKYKKVPDPVQLAFNARETINAFSSVEGKKKPVSQLKVNPDNGGLFASTTGGIIKILRLRV